MLKYIGHPDPELRDDLIYTTFDKWCEARMITAGQMKIILEICLDEQHLFYGIGETNTNSVFTRSFSALMVPLALYVNNRAAFLSDAEIININDTILKYIGQEKDFRGYVDGMGWAHAMAHSADALASLAMHRAIERNGLIEILSTIKTMVANGESTYVYNEDERIAKAAMAVIYYRKILTDEDIMDWLSGFRTISNTGSQTLNMNVKVNQENFLRSLYSKLILTGAAETIVKEIGDIMQSL
jgi:hypothetical protein